MARPTPLRRALARVAFAGLALVLLFAAVLPLDRLPGALPGPDLLMAAAFVWVIRRPDLLPVWIVAAVFLLADLMLMRPPGLMAAAMVLATEYLRGRHDLTVGIPFAAEWGIAASMMASVTIGSAAVMALLSTLAPPLGPVLIRMIFTIMAYPLVVFAARLVFGIGKPGQGEDLAFGGRS